MAVSEQAKRTSEGAQQSSQQNGQPPEQVTITLPSLASLPPLPPIQIEPKRLMWLGGLAVLGIAGVVEWPVIAVVGVGSYLAERFARDEARKNGSRPAQNSDQK
jgi:hypothetical protein